MMKFKIGDTVKIKQLMFTWTFGNYPYYNHPKVGDEVEIVKRHSKNSLTVMTWYYRWYIMSPIEVFRVWRKTRQNMYLIRWKNYDRNFHYLYQESKLELTKDGLRDKKIKSLLDEI